ncbi:hypothetical protein QN277_008961 [Acacia crassicarpa]|uniref:PGG domain-containing protein n=1 Tax=Acacia crassicarpa TaxID=499986 RepID=A0AAE1MDN7_9FABA|nr:hypothetical protein QN277_008961 [Acacia crassicarpa]
MPVFSPRSTERSRLKTISARGFGIHGDMPPPPPRRYGIHGDMTASDAMTARGFARGFGIHGDMTASDAMTARELGLHGHMTIADAMTARTASSDAMTARGYGHMTIVDAMTALDAPWALKDCFVSADQRVPYVRWQRGKMLPEEEETLPKAERVAVAEEKERLSRAERAVADEEERRAKRAAAEEEETRARAKRVAEEQRWAKVEEIRDKVEREAHEQRARIERMIGEVIEALTKLVAEVERRARAEREAEDERRIRVKREVEEEKEKLVMEKKERQDKAEIERRARAKRMEEIANGETLYKAICGNDWDRAKQFLDENPPSSVFLTAKMTSSGKTALHVAALFGHVSIVKELVSLLSPELLETTDDFGNTPLFIATITGITQVAKCLVNKNTNILGILNSTKELPVTQAFLNGHQEMGRYLYSKTPLEYLHPEKSPLQGAMLLHCCLQTQCFDIALDLLNRCPELLFAPDKEGWKPIHGIATLNSAIPSRNELVFWKRLIFDYIDINSNPSSDHNRLPIQRQDTSERAQENLRGPGHRLLERVISSTYNLIGTKKIQEQKLLHAQADKIINLVCKNAGRSDQVSVIADALFLAAEEGNVEFVLRLSKADPDLLLIGDRSYQNIFCYAVGNRQAGVFNLIHGLHFKDVVVTSKDKYGNTLLHVAAAQAAAPVLNRIYGPMLQMQRELQWFTEVESLMPATIRGVRNNDGMTAEELFKEKHQDLMKQGEKWVKATSASCSVVGTLIVTIMFTAAFTVPGGNDQTYGFPLLIKQPFFKLFIFSTILSLISSSTSVLTFLAVLTSHYSEEKFLKSLPIKLILGISSLFISIISMMVAFLSTIYLMLNNSNYSWGLLPMIMLASVPIFLFVLSQFPLLRHSFFATYGSIFNKNVDKWP